MYRGPGYTRVPGTPGFHELGPRSIRVLGVPRSQVYKGPRAPKTRVPPRLGYMRVAGIPGTPHRVGWGELAKGDGREPLTGTTQPPRLCTLGGLLEIPWVPGPVLGRFWRRNARADGPKSGSKLPGPKTRAVWDRILVRPRKLSTQNRPCSPARRPEARLSNPMYSSPAIAICATELRCKPEPVRSLGPHPNRQGTAAADPQTSSNSPNNKSLVFEVGEGDRLATLRVSNAKCESST
jgi:hypothetical protein